MQEFTLERTIAAPYDEAVARVRAALAEAGFGVLTEIDMKATLKAKIDVDIAPRVILGACRPALAHRALEADPRIATMLPCNVVVSAAAGGGSWVEVFDPAAMTSFSASLAIVEVAAEARDRLTRMLERLEGQEA
jgi:uncharacterized protein (DUF302 family)